MHGRFDRDAAAPAAIDAVHDAIHSGRSWHYSRYTSLDANGVEGIVLDLTSAAKEAHLTYEGSFGGDYLIELFEDTTRPVEVGVSPHNRNRKKDLSPIAPANQTLVFLARFDAGADGVVLNRSFAPGGALLITQGGRAETRLEWVLAPTKKYLVKMSNLAGNTQQFSVGLDWYEVD